MALSHDIVLKDDAFTTSKDEMAALKTRTEALKKKMEDMYKELTTALDTPAGKAIEFTAEKVLIKPIEDLQIVIQHISETLSEIISTEHYKGVFIKFEQLNQNINFN